ncbi:hypothetical protein VTJ83DRAFT_7425 [Remersonia thermophila]|uniref:Ras-GAP domain-containing protein n=1 Tax=Remersonia thermophila TaxID=72144 RepID=A0ABR4D4G8_9PEZI
MSTRERRLTSPLPATMDGRPYTLGTSPTASVTPPLPERPGRASMLPPVSEKSPPLLPRSSERASTSNLRGAFRQTTTIRAVTPEPPETALGGLDTARDGASKAPSESPKASPRSIPPGGSNMPARRQGVVFHDSFSTSLESTSTTPPQRPVSFRPRTHTMDGAFRQQLVPNVEARNRIGSFSAATSLSAVEDAKAPSFSSQVDSFKHADLQPLLTASMSKDKRSSSTRSRLTKRPSSRPSSPLSSLPPSVDSLPLPIPTTDANKVLLLMKNLCGRMRGAIECRKDGSGAWMRGICYIDEERGSLMFDPGESGPFHTALISELRGCRVVPLECTDRDPACLEITSAQLGVALYLRPLVAEELDLWLAALLCWQQLRSPSTSKSPSTARPGNAATTGTPAWSEMKRRVSSTGLREPAVIKVGKVMLWDKGAAVTPRAIVKRPSTRDLRSSQTCWRQVSCILHDNGELKIMTENDTTVLSVIALSQLARSAVQQLDRSVLDEDYCLAIFPTYSSTSTQLSIFRPVYVALESRVLFEVWFVLLRAFTIPDMFNIDPAKGGRLCEVTNFQQELPGETFRVEKTIAIRVTEARLRSRTLAGEDWQSKGSDSDPMIGNYLAEVILDGEVRARTTTKMETKNPFWREDSVFTDLPVLLPYLSILLKRVDGVPESFAHQIQATLGLARNSHMAEVVCGSVDILLDQLECGKDHEQWIQIYDDRQQSIGSMLLRIHHEELVVLLQRHYQPLSDLLHRFSTGLTAQISEALPGSLRRLAEVLVNIFQVSGSASEWLINLAEEEIDGIGDDKPSSKKPRFSGRLKSNDSIESNTDRNQIVRDLGKSLQGEANLLFRGNSLLTQALEYHMRRLGREYLQETLAEKIAEINDSDHDCEVDPSKIHHGEDIQKHWSHLINFTADIWERITLSAPRLPPELRHILKYIRAVAEDRYGDFLRTVAYTSVSGFLFLRFLCPAILSPKLFGLLRDHPRPRAQRTLTLIAKSLQALANLTTIGKKEPWMEPMNKFLSTQRQALKNFLDEVCAIPADRTKTPLPAPYSTPNTILGRLSPMAREGFPSLPYLVDQGRNFAALVKLWADAHTPSSPSSSSSSTSTNVSSNDQQQQQQLQQQQQQPPQPSPSPPPPPFQQPTYEGDLLRFHTICMGLHQRSMACLARIEAARSAAAAAATDPTSPTSLVDEQQLVDVMERVNIDDMLTLSGYNGYGGSASPTAWGGMSMSESSEALQPPGSSGSDIDTGMTSPQWGAISVSRDSRQGSFSREVSSSSLRQMARNSEIPSAHPGGGSGGGGGAGSTVRSLRNGIHPRRLISGIIRRTRTTSPDSPAATSPGAGILSWPGSGGREGEFERERDGDQLENARMERGYRDREREREREASVSLSSPRVIETIGRPQ